MNGNPWKGHAFMEGRFEQFCGSLSHTAAHFDKLHRVLGVVVSPDLFYPATELLEGSDHFVVELKQLAMGTWVVLPREVAEEVERYRVQIEEGKWAF